MISAYRDTIAYAGLDKPDTMPSETQAYEEVETMETSPVRGMAAAERSAPHVIQGMALPIATGENDIKVLLDGDRLRVSAYVDIKGAKRLLKALRANMALLEDDDDADDHQADNNQKD